MYIKKQLYTFGLAILGMPVLGMAQTQSVSTFDDLTLSGSDTNYAASQPIGSFSFQSGNALFYGNIDSFMYASGFDYSNRRDDSTQTFLNDRSAITAMGADSSDNYGICFVNIDFMGPNPTATIPVGTKIISDSQTVSGAYITNTTYAYWYMKNNFQVGNWFKLTVRGYLNGQKANSDVDFVLGKVDSNGSDIINKWEWLDLSGLGEVDSLTFDLSSNDTAGGFGMNNPAYFAIDNLTLLKIAPDSTTGNDSTNTGLQNFAQNILNTSIAPNPAKDFIQIANGQNLHINIYDLNGRMLLNAENKTRVDVSTLANGIYILQAIDQVKGQKANIKFIKQ